MRLLFVVQRYGIEVFGGAEAFPRAYATELARRGHDVEVLTSCAVSYVDWANAYAPGTSEVDGITVHRLPVDRTRDNALFNPLNGRVNGGGPRPTPLHLQRAWMDLQGPHLPELPGWIEDQASRFDVAVFFTYLYWSTWAGLPAAGRHLPTVLHPAAHDEPPLYLGIFDLLFRHPRGFGFLSPEEASLVLDRFRVRRPTITTGVGVDLDAVGDEARFRAAYDLGDAPYLLYIGRIDPSKGTDELVGFYRTYRARHHDDLRLVLLGEEVHAVERQEGIVVTGFVDEATKHDAIAGSLAVVMPSYFESFSIALLDGWSHHRPVLVQGNCGVLDGQVRRSNGGLPYRGYAEFEAAVELLLEDEPLAEALGESGRRYVEDTYDWDVLLRRYVRFLEHVA